MLVDIQTINNKTIEIHTDDDPPNPRREFDNLGTMVCFHKLYNLGDKHDLNKNYFSSWDEMRGYIEKNNKVACILPLYLYDHSGISMSVGKFSCPWDSGQVGYIYITKEKLLEEFSMKRISKKLRDHAEKILRSEVETYDRYLTGNVYGYILKNEAGEQIESCWGYFDEPKEIIREILGSN